MYQLIEGDLLETEAKYLCHQCNCVSTGASGIAAAIFDKFPYADIYSDREGFTSDELPLEGEQPGDIVVCGNDDDERYIINMMAQYYPGSPKYPDSTKDGFLARQSYFIKCLKKILEIPDLESIAFPYKIGCGIAGGEWNIYSKILKIFAGKTQADVYVYRLEGVEGA